MISALGPTDNQIGGAEKKISAGWTIASVHPRFPEKNFKVYREVDGVGFASDTSGARMQHLPRSLGYSCARETAKKFFGAIPAPHWAGHFLTAAVALAISTNAAVKISAPVVISQYLRSFGAKYDTGRDPIQFYDANRQTLARLKKPKSASAIIALLLKEMGLDSQAQVLLHRGTHGKLESVDLKTICRRSVVIIPLANSVSAEVADQMFYELSTGIVKTSAIELCKKTDWKSFQKQAAQLDLSSDYFSNFVEKYMQKNITRGMFKPVLNEDQAVQYIRHSSKYNGNTPYQRSLIREVRQMYADGFKCHYRTTANSSRMFVVGGRIQFIPVSIRKPIFPNLIELDFANMHLAMANKELNLGFDLSTSFWSQLYAEQAPLLDELTAAASGSMQLDELQAVRPAIYSDLPSHIQVQRQFMTESFLKDFNKTATYAVLFGKPASSHIHDTTQALRDRGVQHGFALILARIICRSGLIGKISDGLTSFCKEASWSFKDLSRHFQSLEGKYAEHLYQIAEEMGTNRVRILIHSHDGVSVQFANREAATRFFSKIEEQLHTKLKADGIESRIEAKLSDGRKIDLKAVSDSDLVGFNIKAKRKIKKSIVRSTKSTLQSTSLAKEFFPMGLSDVPMLRCLLIPWDTGPP